MNEGSSTLSPYGNWLRVLAHKATKNLMTKNKSTNDTTKTLQIFKSRPSAQHTSRLYLALSQTFTIIPQCSACKARPGGKFENSIKKIYTSMLSERFSII